MNTAASTSCWGALPCLLILQKVQYNICRSLLHLVFVTSVLQVPLGWCICHPAQACIISYGKIEITLHKHTVEYFRSFPQTRRVWAPGPPTTLHTSLGGEVSTWLTISSAADVEEEEEEKEKEEKEFRNGEIIKESPLAPSIQNPSSMVQLVNRVLFDSSYMVAGHLIDYLLLHVYCVFRVPALVPAAGGLIVLDLRNFLLWCQQNPGSVYSWIRVGINKAIKKKMSAKAVRGA